MLLLQQLVEVIEAALFLLRLLLLWRHLWARFQFSQLYELPLDGGLLRFCKPLAFVAALDPVFLLELLVLLHVDLAQLFGLDVCFSRHDPAKQLLMRFGQPLLDVGILVCILDLYGYAAEEEASTDHEENNFADLRLNEEA